VKEKFGIPESQPLKKEVAKEFLMSFSLDVLFDLMIDKINEIRLPSRHHMYDGRYSEIMQEIMLIQKIIVTRKSENNVTH
jgi:hypothetical protein